MYIIKCCTILKFGYIRDPLLIWEFCIKLSVKNIFSNKSWILRQSKVILIADRGYESFNNIAHCQEKNWNYIIRSKESYGIKFDTPPSETFDIDQLITLTRRQTKQTKEFIKKEPNRYLWIQPHTTFDYLKPKEDKLYDLPIRIVRFEIADSH